MPGDQIRPNQQWCTYSTTPVQWAARRYIWLKIQAVHTSKELLSKQQTLQIEKPTYSLAFQKINSHDIISLVCLKLHTVTLRQCFPRHILKASVISLLFHHYHQRHRKSSRNQGFTSRLAPIFKTAQWSLNCSVLSDTKICYWTFTNEAIFQFDWENTHLNTSEYCFGLLFMSVLSNWRIHSHSVPAVSQATLRSRIPQQKRLCLASKPLLQLLCCDK